MTCRQARRHDQSLLKSYLKKNSILQEVSHPNPNISHQIWANDNIDPHKSLGIPPVSPCGTNTVVHAGF